MRVLVTGGKGFIGSHMVNYLKARNHWVRSVDVKEKCYLKTEEDDFLRLDLTNPRNAMRAMKDTDWVLNFSANMGGIGFITKVRADVMHDNVLINANLLEASVKNGVKRFFFASSACVYPQYVQESPEVQPLQEQDAFPAYPDSCYGWEKMYAERMALAYSKDYELTIRIARYHNIFGPYGTWSGGREKAPAALCRKIALAKNPGVIEIWGDGQQTRSFLYIFDCIEATYRLMESNYPLPLNIGSNRLVTISELADIIIGISGKQIRKKYNLDMPQGVRGRNADLRMLREALDLPFFPKVTLEEGLKETYHWIESQITPKQ